MMNVAKIQFELPLNLATVELTARDIPWRGCTLSNCWVDGTCHPLTRMHRDVSHVWILYNENIYAAASIISSSSRSIYTHAYRDRWQWVSCFCSRHVSHWRTLPHRNRFFLCYVAINDSVNVWCALAVSSRWRLHVRLHCFSISTQLLSAALRARRVIGDKWRLQRG